jgi:HEAT repeats
VPLPPPVTVLGAISLRDLTPREDAPARLDVPALEGALRVRLLGSGQFAPSPDAGASQAVTSVRGQLGIDGAEVGDRGLARARVSLHLETRPMGAPGALEERLEGAGEEPYPVVSRAGHHARPDAGAPPSKDQIYQRLVARVAGDLVDGFAARRHLAQAPVEELRVALGADAGEGRLEAIRLIGERHFASESGTLLKLLEDPDETTRDAALGALITLGDRRAVSVLTRTRSLRDRRELRKIIEAIGVLGGQEADDYLSFIAGSHDDEEIRAEAAAARARLQRREADASPNGR